MKEVVEEGEAGEIARLFVPEAALQIARDANDVFWRVWDIYWILLIAR